MNPSMNVEGSDPWAGWIESTNDRVLTCSHSTSPLYSVHESVYSLRFHSLNYLSHSVWRLVAPHTTFRLGSWQWTGLEPM